LGPANQIAVPNSVGAGGLGAGRDLRYDAAMNTSIVVLDGPVATDVAEPAPDRLVAGKTVTRVSNYFSEATQQFFAGRWAATRGKWRVVYTENELCVMTAGKVVIESASGGAQHLCRWRCFRGSCGVLRNLGGVGGLQQDLRYFRVKRAAAAGLSPGAKRAG